MNAAARCPVCSIDLVNNQCGKYQRLYYPIKDDDNKQKQKLDYDFETSSSESEPILLVSEDNAHSINNKKLREGQTESEREHYTDKGVSYIRKHFGNNVQITTRVEMPT